MKRIETIRLLLTVLLCAVLTGESVWGMELGGFDVEVGVGTYPDDGSWGQEWNGDIAPGKPQEGIPQNPTQDFQQRPPQELPQNPPQDFQQNPSQDWQWQEKPPVQQWGDAQMPNQNWSDGNDLYGNQGYQPAVPGIQPSVQGSTPAPDTDTTPMNTPIPTPTMPPIPESTPTPIPTPTVTPAPTPSAEPPYVYYRNQLPPPEDFKEESVEFRRCFPEGSACPEITVRSKGSVQILSFRINGREVAWHWRKNVIVPEVEFDVGENQEANPKIEIMFLSQGISLSRWQEP